MSDYHAPSADLESITELDLSGRSVADLKSHDFHGMLRLRSLDLSSNALRGRITPCKELADTIG